MSLGRHGIMGKRTRNVVLGALAGLGLALAGPAGADPVRGGGLMVATDVAARTVTLQAGTVLRVDDGTRIVDRDDRLLSFADLSAAREFAGGLEVRGENQIRFEGQSRSGGVVDADLIVVMNGAMQ